MKKFITFFVLMLSVTFASAQDVIVKKDGSTIMSKVTEIGNTEIKYKKFSNQNGPTYSLSISEIMAINYENGEKETFDEILQSSPQIQQPQYDYSDKVAEGIRNSNILQRERLLASAKNWRVAGSVVSCTGVIGGLLLAIPALKEDDQTGYWIVYGSCAGTGLIAGLICQTVSGNKKKAAEAIQTAHIMQQDFNVGNARLTVGLDIMNDRYSRERGFGLGLSYTF